MTQADDPLAVIALLADMDAGARRELAAQCRWHDFARGAVIVNADALDRDLLLCISGEVEVTSYSVSGRQVNFARLGPGDHFGELAAIDGRMRSATAVAASATRIAKVPHATFERLLTEHPALARRMLESLAGVIRRLNERVLDMNTLTAHQRVVRELLAASQPSPVASGQWIIQPAPTQATIAARADTTRETTARVLSDLRQEGLISVRGSCMTVHNMSALAEMAGPAG